MAQAQKMDVAQMCLGIFLLGALAIGILFFITDKAAATLFPAQHAAWEARIHADAQAQQDAQAERDRAQAVRDAVPTASVSDSANVMDFSTSHVLAKGSLLNILRDPDSVRFRHVYAYRTEQGDKAFYVFCGELIAKNSFGGYGDYERFIATPVASTLESGASDFSDARAQLCPRRAAEAMPVPF